MNDIAGRWIRVSGDSQSEEDQLPDIDTYCDTAGYLKGKIYEVHGKSAFKGAQDPYWRNVVADVQAGVITVVVLWMVDRMDRKNILHAIPMALAVLDAGGRIEFSEQPECNLDASDPNIDDKVKSFSDRIHAANQESKIKSKRIRKCHAKKRRQGSALGRAPWGYSIFCTVCNRAPVKPDCKDHRKIFTPTTDGRQYAPVVFDMAVNGASCRDIAAWLTGQGVLTDTGLTVWNEGFVSRLIKNPVYYGARRNAGELETEALVSYSTWQAAGAALSAKIRPGRSTTKHPKALLRPVCGNLECDATGPHPSPMYRMNTGYYRCYGSGPQRRGCGNMVLVADLDQRVTEAFETNHAEPHTERVFVPGDDRSDQIGRLREQAMDAYRSGDKAKFLELDAQADELAATPAVRPHWDEQETDLDKGEYFAGLDAAGQREYIADHVIAACKLDDDIVVGIMARELIAG
jgi:DNA invertase Pin-like site-specific DNA recombinase